MICMLCLINIDVLFEYEFNVLQVDGCVIVVYGFARSEVADCWSSLRTDIENMVDI